MLLKDKLQIYTLSVVLIGDFNPVIFQPAWLASKGLVRENEADKVEMELIHKELVRYNFDWAKFEINQNRFEIRTSQEPYFEAVRDLIVGIFKKHLKETPITALGLNHIKHYQLSSEQYYDFGNTLSPLANWKDSFRDPKLFQLEMLDSKRADDKEGYLRVKVSVSDEITTNAVSININDHYGLSKDSKGRSGEIISILEDNWDNSFALSDSISENLWKKIRP